MIKYEKNSETSLRQEFILNYVITDISVINFLRNMQ